MPLSKSNGRTVAGDATAQDISPALASFVGEIADLANSVDPALAVLLTGEASVPARRWDGGHRRGLVLCLKMLRYARDEVARGDEGKRLDACIEHVVARLAFLDSLSSRPSDTH